MRYLKVTKAFDNKMRLLFGPDTPYKPMINRSQRAFYSRQDSRRDLLRIGNCA